MNHGIKRWEAAPVVQIAQKFEHFRETYRRPDGSRWGGQDLHNATGGVVTRSYVTALRTGQDREPRLREAQGYSQGDGFPPELWFEEGVSDGIPVEPPHESRDVAGRLEHLFWVVKNQRTGQPYTRTRREPDLARATSPRSSRG